MFVSAADFRTQYRKAYAAFRRWQTIVKRTEPTFAANVLVTELQYYDLRAVQAAQDSFDMRRVSDEIGANFRREKLLRSRWPLYRDIRWQNDFYQSTD